MADHFGHLSRSGSSSSLSSLSGDRKYNRGGGGGALRVEIKFSPPGPKDKKSAGAVHVLIKEGKKLTTDNPYVKLYLSKDGKDIKGTKQKTKAQHKTFNPLYEDRFVYFLKAKTAVDSSTRLQITVWSAHSGMLKHNDCEGGMSFSLEELVGGEKTGWYGLQPEIEGRTSSMFLTAAEEIDELMIPEPLVGIAPAASPAAQRKASKREKKALPADPKAGKKDKKDKKALPANPSDTVDAVDAEATFDRFASRFESSPKTTRKADPATGVAPSSSVANIASSAAPASAASSAPPTSVLSSTPPSSVPVLTSDTPVSKPPQPVFDSAAAVTAPVAFSVTSSVTQPPRSTTTEDDELPPAPSPEDAPPPTATVTSVSSSSAAPGTGPGSDKTAFVRSVSKYATPVQPPPVTSAPPGGTRGGGGAADADDTAAYSGGRGLTRSNSQMSLVSVAAADVESADHIAGAVRVEISADNTVPKPSIKVTVVAGEHLVVKDPYVKMYLSKDGQDVKSTKKKTGHVKKAKHAEVGNPVFNETFTFTLPAQAAVGYRLQFSVWCHQRTRANICAGGFSFSVSELFASKETSGSFELLKFADGRTRHSRVLSDTSGSFAEDDTANVLTDMVVPTPATSQLTRSNSQESLASVVSNIQSSSHVEGDLNLYLFYEPDTSGKKGCEGTIYVTVNEGRGLEAKEPYVKLYLSKDGENIRSTKQKTKSQRKFKDKNPLFQEKFTYKLSSKTPLDDSSRLQLAVWDSKRTKANMCTGGMSFSLADIASTSRTSGWFQLLPYHEGRTRNVHVGGGSQTTGATTASGLLRGTGSVSATTLLDNSISSQGVNAKSSGKGKKSSDKGSKSSDKGSKSSGKGSKSSKDSKTATQPPSGVAPLASSTASKSKNKSTISLLGGSSKIGKKELAELQEREERHIAEKAVLEEKIQAYREQVEQMADLQSRNLRLQNQLADTNSSVERVDRLQKEVDKLNEENESLSTENARMNEFIKLHKDDADQRRDQIVVLRDCLSDQKDENKGLRVFISSLQNELLQVDPKAFARALGRYNEAMV